ncbi:tRNA (5-methylaminomethyl-2-thiouridine)(34)-methyltransferase MnmD [Rapidithrix thailandica]|uniref:tRNA (5-methylaminomethyl-2-thiouridine)(34)-methyltransferase MnmD n=1 Tax=Rapidithrix thailandica TaxID=413964 RepID=A0AAW9S087_9BACT
MEKHPSDIQVIKTSDGSSTLYNKNLDETYHSSHGAITESRHVFLKEGIEFFLQRQPKKISVLEVGFGTGLNALLTLEFAKKHSIEMKYVTLEPFPVSESLVKELNYPEYFESEELRQAFYQLHELPWDKEHSPESNFYFKKVNAPLLEYSEEGCFDVVYYDAFAPRKQPEMWELDNLQKTFDLCNPQGILVTYCSNGQFKRNLKAVGYKVEGIPGPPGKREMTRAYKL